MKKVLYSIIIILVFCNFTQAQDIFSIFPMNSKVDYEMKDRYFPEHNVNIKKWTDVYHLDKLVSN